MSAPEFVRARKPEERAVRRQAILAAAGKLFDAHGVAGTGINAIAAEAGFTKSNIYRYFESREAVLLELFIDAFTTGVAELEAALRAAPKDDMANAARLMAKLFADNGRMGPLFSILASVLEQNVSPQAIVTLKTQMLALLQGLAAALHECLPSIAIEDCAFVVKMSGVAVTGLWPAAHPPEAVARIVAQAEFGAMRTEFGRDLERVIFVLLRGVRA